LKISQEGEKGEEKRWGLRAPPFFLSKLPVTTPTL